MIHWPSSDWSWERFVLMAGALWNCSANGKERPILPSLLLHAMQTVRTAMKSSRRDAGTGFRLLPVVGTGAQGTPRRCSTRAHNRIQHHDLRAGSVRIEI